MISLHYTEAQLRPTAYQVSCSQTPRRPLLATDELAFLITLLNTPPTSASHSARSQKENINLSGKKDTKTWQLTVENKQVLMFCYCYLGCIKDETQSFTLSNRSTTELYPQPLLLLGTSERAIVLGHKEPMQNEMTHSRHLLYQILKLWITGQPSKLYLVEGDDTHLYKQPIGTPLWRSL